MKVRELTVTNFRGFAGERRFQLSDRFTVIAGINGRGKSSLLDGLALLLARLLRALSLSAGNGRTISANDVHAGQAEAALAKWAPLSVNEEEAHISAPINVVVGEAIGRTSY